MLARAAFLCVVVLVAAGCGATTHHASKPPAAKRSSVSQLHGLVPTPLPTAPTFTLTDTAGHPFSFATHARGKLTYLYFGYTHCPDVCPLTMGTIAAAVRSVSPAVRRKIQVVFVSVDPKRDTSSVLRRWLNHYNRSFIGLTGSEQQIRAAALATGIPLPPPQKHTSASYSLDHSAFVLPFSPDGRAHVVYAQGFTAADYAHDMPILLRL
jgi:protein SCO1/2